MRVPSQRAACRPRRCIACHLSRRSGGPAGLGLLRIPATWLSTYGIDRSIWHEEAYGPWVAAMDAGAMVRTLAEQGEPPPLYYLLLEAWIAAFGDGEPALRLHSALR